MPQDFVASNGVGVRYRENGDIEVTTLFGWALAMPRDAASAVLEFLSDENESHFPYPHFEFNPEHAYTRITHIPSKQTPSNAGSDLGPNPYKED